MVIKKIDELGRIVIPKDIRRALKLEEGDFMEIGMEKDFVAIKKTSFIKNLSSEAEAVARAVFDELKACCIVSDLEEVVATSGGATSGLLGAALTKVGKILVKDRQTLVGENCPLFDGKIEKKFFLALPVQKNGDAFGILALFFDKPLDDKKEEAKLAARLLAELL